jgi:hypothetical protein
VLVHHLALPMFAAGAARRIRAAALMILATLWRISEAVGGSESGRPKKHDRCD